MDSEPRDKSPQKNDRPRLCQSEFAADAGQQSLPEIATPLSRRGFFETATAGSIACFAGLNQMLPAMETAALTPLAEFTPNMIGAYGSWAAGIIGDQPARLSYRQSRFQDADKWRAEARARVQDCLAPPQVPPITDVRVESISEFDGVIVEQLSWQLAYGPRTNAVLLKPAGVSGRLPAVIGLHDHGGKKYFGLEKIARTGSDQHPMMAEHQQQYYGGKAWANELARRGYAVLVHDTFTFASRRVHMDEVAPGALGRHSLVTDQTDESIVAYNKWAADHEHLMAKSLLCAGTTWPGVFLTEDQRALDYLCSRSDVDPARIGCAGLSGGGLRTVYLGGLDERIRCACCVGMMSTWRDYLLHKCFTHTWMIYIPLIARDLDYPEILALRAPAATLVLNDLEDTLFSVSEMRRADEMMRAVFDKAGAAERYRCTFYPGPHKFDLPMQAEAFDWFDRWLK